MRRNSGGSELKVTLANLPLSAEYPPNNSLNRYILCTYCVLVILVGTGAGATNKTDKVPVLVALPVQQSLLSGCQPQALQGSHFLLPTTVLLEAPLPLSLVGPNSCAS